MPSAERQTTVNGRSRGRPRDENTRQRVLQAALKLLAEVGYSQVTIEAIAALAKASKATLYRWWPNKVSILIEAFREVASEKLPSPCSGLLREDVHIFMRTLVEVLGGWKGHYSQLF